MITLYGGIGGGMARSDAISIWSRLDHTSKFLVQQECVKGVFSARDGAFRVRDPLFHTRRRPTAQSAEPSEEIVRSRTWKPSSAESPTHECCILLIVTACGDHEREAVGKIEGSANSNIRTYSNFNLL